MFWTLQKEKGSNWNSIENSNLTLLCSLYLLRYWNENSLLGHFMESQHTTAIATTGISADYFYHHRYVAYFNLFEASRLGLISLGRGFDKLLPGPGGQSRIHFGRPKVPMRFFLEHRKTSPRATDSNEWLSRIELSQLLSRQFLLHSPCSSYPPTLPSLCQGRAAPGTTLGVEQPTLAAPWPPCCPPLLHLAAPLGAPSRPRKLSLRFRSWRLAPSNPCNVSQGLQARVTMQLAYPGPWPPCCPPELPFGTLKPLQGLAAPPSTCQNAASLPLLHRGHPAAQPCCTLLLPLLHLPGPECFFYGSEADVWHPQTLVRSRSAFKHVSQRS